MAFPSRPILTAAWLLACAPSMAFAANPCHAGDTLIGETKQFYYCSHVSCGDIGAQLTKDEVALRRLQTSMAATNAELQEWGKANDEAQREALGKAKSFLIRSVLEKVAVGRETKLEAIENDIKRADPMGTTWTAKLVKLAAFRRSYGRLTTQIAALKVVKYPGVNIYETWSDFSARARTIGEEGQVVASTWRELATDPEMQQAFREHGFEFSADALKTALRYPLLTQTIDFAQFAVDYGYDAKKWNESRRLIEQNANLSDKNLYAECVLSRHLRVTVRNLQVCHGDMPPDNAPRPEDLKCVDHSSP
jgi:hypothetical protein